jgi:ligand-binding sensor domain-containing protein/signal transduction histidine kinase
MAATQVLLAWLAGGICFAQAQHAAQPRWSHMADTVFQHITAEQGLPKGFNTALAQDGDGYLWVGSPDGLARWDGYRTKMFRPDAKDPTALPDRFIQTLHTDPQGRLWIGTSSGGLARYDRAHERFINIPAGPAGLSNIAVNSIADDGANGVWVATDGGLDHVDAANNRVSHLRPDEPGIGSLPPGRIGVVLRARDGALWVGNQSGLAWRANGSKKFQSLPLPAVNGQVPGVSYLMQASDGRIWIGTIHFGAYVYDPKNDSVRNIIESGVSGTADSPLATGWINAIAEARPGEIWLGTFGDGIVAVDSATLQTKRIQHDASLPTSLGDNSIWSILRSRSGLIWISTSRGVSRTDPQQTAVLTFFGLSARQPGLSDPDVRSIRVAPDGRVWLGLGSNGVEIIDPTGQNSTSMRPDPRHPDSALQQGRIFSIIDAAQGGAYLGTDRGLYHVDQSGQHIQRLPVTQRAGLDTRALLLDGGQLLIGGFDGVWSFDLSGGTLLPRIHPQGAQTLTDPRISSMLAGADGTVWIATRNGLNRLDQNNHTLEQIPADPGDPQGLSASNISSLLIDRKGRLWVGTLGGGINILEGRGPHGEPRFRHLGIAQGMPNQHIDMLLADLNGKIWASTDDGLAMIDPDTFAIRSLQRAEGVEIQTYWSGAGAVTPQGELLFGGVGGFTVVRPEQLKSWYYRPPLVVTEVRIGGQTVPASHFNGDHRPDEKLAPLTIAPDANSLAVEFSALDYTAPERNHYAYQLEGYDHGWISSDASRRVATYTNLPPGVYRLRLRGSNRYGVWTEQELLLPIRVLPAWYQTWWCHLLELLAALGAIFALVQARTAYLRQGQRQLESQVAQRTVELEQNQAELVAANLELNHANAALARSAATLHELGDVGRDITANLDLESAFETLHQHVGRLLDAPRLAIYRVTPEGNTLELSFGREYGAVLPCFNIALDATDSNTARTAREWREVLIELEPGANLPHPTLSRDMVSALYAPLIVDERLLGVMSIQSAHCNAYGERERLIFRTLCAYGAIALDNANAYRQLQETQAKLVEQEKLAALGSLVAGVAHELNTPIGNSLLMLSALQGKTDAFNEKINGVGLRRSDLIEFLDDTQEASAVILRGLTSAADLVSSFKQVAVDRTTAHRREYDLQHTSHEVIATMMNRIRLAGHSISLDIAEGILINSYPGPYGQVIANLINNALLHAFDNSKRGNITISARLEVADRVLIDFADDGAGIGPDDLKRIFDPFFTTKMGRGGSGLGLSISYNIVTSLLHGNISVDSTLGQGTRFMLDLPLTAPMQPDQSGAYPS